MLGFAGLYLFVGILYLVLVLRIVNQGPDDDEPPAAPAAPPAGALEPA
jgi:hypothetical protein